MGRLARELQNRIRSDHAGADQRLDHPAPPDQECQRGDPKQTELPAVAQRLGERDRRAEDRPGVPLAHEERLHPGRPRGLPRSTVVVGPTNDHRRGRCLGSTRKGVIVSAGQLVLVQSGDQRLLCPYGRRC